MAKQIVSGVTEKVLTHEVGAGAPCLKCGDKCPGLDLHFWRKICRNCKCSQENHDVNVSVSGKGIDNIGKLLMQDNEILARQQTRKEESPTQSPDKQLARQTETKKSPSSAMYNETNAILVTNESVGTTSVVEDGSELASSINKKQEPLIQSEKVQESSSALSEDFPQSSLETFSSKEDSSIESSSIPKMYQQDTQETVDASDESQTFPKPPKEVENSNDLMRPTTLLSAEAEVSKKHTVQGNSVSLSDDKTVKYDWKPAVSDTKLIQKYIEALPEEKQPIAGTEGSQYRKKQLMRQLPTHDQSPSDCHDLTPKEINEMETFVEQYREKSLGEAKVKQNSKTTSCVECQEEIKIGDPAVAAERAGSDKHWHPGCFICAECRELLVDLIYFYDQDSIYCGRHYCELHKPRCAACDELIFAPEYTQAEDSYWHLKHFCCWHCDQPLGGTNYVPHNNQPVCIPCYEKSFANACSTCKKVIAPDTEWVTFENHHWHANADCFLCTQCGQSLVGQPCIPKDDMVFCSSNCKKKKLSPSTEN